MQTLTHARNQIGPLLDALIRELDVSGCATQRAYFARMRGQLDGATDHQTLSVAIMELSSSTAIGLTLPTTASALMGRILEKTAELIAQLEGVAPHVH